MNEEPPVPQAAPAPVKLVCAWCNKVSQEGQDLTAVSHGICEVCRTALEKEQAAVRSTPRSP